MSKTMNRRAMLSGATILPMLALPAIAQALPALPKTQGPSLDADFIVTVAKVKSDVQEMYLMDKAHMAKFRATMAKYPPFPEVLKMTPRDEELGLPMTKDPRYPGYFTTFQLSELEECKGRKRLEIPVAEYKPSKGAEADYPVLYYPNKGIVVCSGPNPEADARVAELKVAIRKWKAACNRVERAASTDEANSKSDTFWDAVHQRYRRLVGYKPKTIEGLTTKAELVWLMHIGETSKGLQLGDSTDCRMISAIFNDIRRLAKAAGLSNA